MAWVGRGKQDISEVVYDGCRWELLRNLREKAAKVMRALAECGIPSITHGSVARGDVKPGSDVDVVIPFPVAPSRLVSCLELKGFRIYRACVVQATPAHTPKVYYDLDYEGKTVASHPLKELNPREREFYKFGGEVDLNALLRGVRVPGVSKELKLIIPTEYGHLEYPVVGNEHYVAEVIGVSPETVMERVRILRRRAEMGRTGVFLEECVGHEETVEGLITRLIKSGRLRLIL